jgi:hypothetical protein
MTCLAVAATTPAAAQAPTLPANPMIQVEYIRPTLGSNPVQFASFETMYAWLLLRRPLEELSIFLAPLKLPSPIKIQVDACGAERRAYVPGKPVTICYELIDKIEKVAAGVDNNIKQKVIAGTFVQAVLHETAYAVFDVLKIPVWGRADDAADRLSAYVLLQFSGEIATLTIVGSAEFFLASSRTWTGSEFAATVSPEAQRFYNFLCIAYGGDKIDFGGWTLAPQGQDPLLPQHRAQQCAHEYAQVRHAFDLRIMPYVDPDLMLQVKSAQWLLPQELSK